MNGIIELRQTAENNWKARYQGNYGIYTIKITTDGKKTTKFSCSCPSDYYPCKHIAMVEEAIADIVAQTEENGKRDELQPEELIKNVSMEKLREFLIAQLKYNQDLLDAFLLEFAVNAEDSKGNKYSGIIRRALASFSFDEDDYYYSEETQDIDPLDQWYDKAMDYMHQKKYEEAILICKAWVEEYSQWLYNAEDDVSMMFSSDYQSLPFGILEEAAEHTGKKKLFDYCLSEMKMKKYDGTEFQDEFHRLLGNLALTVDPDTFIAMQDKLFADIKDKSSYDARTILGRKIDFYRRLGQEDKAWALMEQNIQIESFREEVIRKKIREKDFSGAKKLINDNTQGNSKNRSPYHGNPWNELLLDIAQKEKDIPAIRDLSYGFLQNHFSKQYYDIYKRAFSPSEWESQREKLFTDYSKGRFFSHAAAELLVEEKDTQRLADYVEKYLSVQDLENYHKNFATAYPEKTVELFRKALVSYAEKNTGRSCYEYILKLLKMMSKIKGGKEAASELVAYFRIHYKIRKAMIEILGRF